jgi:hypothetical protein
MSEEGRPMGKYKGHEEFGVNAPINWREKATSESYLKGMSRIAPPNMTPREQRGKRFEERTDKPESAKWHHNYDIAMFGGTEIPKPTYQSKQMALEEMLDGITRIPHVKRR